MLICNKLSVRQKINLHLSYSNSYISTPNNRTKVECKYKWISYSLILIRLKKKNQSECKLSSQDASPSHIISNNRTKVECKY